MPSKPKRLCAVDGCPNIINVGETYCAEHLKLKRKLGDRRRGNAAGRGYDRNWQRLRKLVLHSEPLCRECKRNGKLTAATEVDHIVPLTASGTNDWENLQPLCHECHSRKTAAENGGFGNPRGEGRGESLPPASIDRAGRLGHN